MENIIMVLILLIILIFAIVSIVNQFNNKRTEQTISKQEKVLGKFIKEGLPFYGRNIVTENIANIIANNSPSRKVNTQTIASLDTNIQEDNDFYAVICKTLSNCNMYMKLLDILYFHSQTGPMTRERILDIMKKEAGFVLEEKAFIKIFGSMNGFYETVQNDYRINKFGKRIYEDISFHAK